MARQRTLQLKNKKYSKKTVNEWLWAYFLIAPTFLGLFILNIIPTFQTLYLSFFKSGDFGKGNVWVGLDNYRKIFISGREHDQIFQAIWNTFGYTLMVVPASIVISMILAVLLNQKVKGQSFYRTIFFLPMVAAPAAVAMVWRWLYNAEFGLINHLLSLIGIQGPNWITDPKLALLSIAVVGIWASVGYNIVILLAGLQEIPGDFYEAASIDGAGPFSKFFNITLPLVSPTTFFIMVTSIIQSLQVFDVIYMMMGISNPALDKTQSLVYLFNKTSFDNKDKGYGSAIVMLLLAIIMMITFFQIKAQKKWVKYQ